MVGEPFPLLIGIKSSCVPGVEAVLRQMDFRPQFGELVGPEQAR